MRSSATAAVWLTATVLAGCGGPTAVPTPATTTSSSPTAPAAPSSAPAGWRWESYGDAEIAVPPDWKSDGTSTGNILNAWCVEPGANPGQVARPGVTSAVGCANQDPALVSRTGQFVAFVGAYDTTTHADLGDRVYRRPGSFTIAIQAAEPLRSRIAATARRIVSVDAHGCAPEHPISTDRAWRPTGAPPVADLTGVTGISACRYALPEFGAVSGPGLLSSTDLNEGRARRLVAAVAEAPVGGGPDQPHSCVPESAWGEEAIVAVVHRASAPDATLVMRYSSCDHNGIDDGTAVHRLSADDAPLTAGANRPDHWAGAGKGAALGHPEVH